MRALRSRRKPELLDLSDVEQRLRPFSRTYIGARVVPLDHVVGTEGRVGAFTRDFQPRHAFSRDRLRSLETAFPDGGFPPIVAVKLGETYFVIDADVTEFVARVPLPPGADMVEVILRELERVFIEESGLAEARRGVRVSASRPFRYLELLENLQVHGYHLMREHNRVLPAAEIAAEGYDRFYSPVVAACDRASLGKDYRDAPDADLFLLLHRRRRESFPSCGCPPLEETMAAMASEAAAKRRRLPRLLRR